MTNHYDPRPRIVAFFSLIAMALICMAIMPYPAYGAEDVQLPPNAVKVVKNTDGNYYALYPGKVAALTKIKTHTKTITVPKNIKVNGTKYKVVAIHEVGLFERKDVKKVTIRATNLETVEEPALFKEWRINHHSKLKVKITNKTMRQWLNARW